MNERHLFILLTLTVNMYSDYLEDEFKLEIDHLLDNGLIRRIPFRLVISHTGAKIVLKAVKAI